MDLKFISELELTDFEQRFNKFTKLVSSKLPNLNSYTLTHKQSLNYLFNLADNNALRAKLIASKIDSMQLLKQTEQNYLNPTANWSYSLICSYMPSGFTIELLTALGIELLVQDINELIECNIKSNIESKRKYNKERNNESRLQEEKVISLVQELRKYINRNERRLITYLNDNLAISLMQALKKQNVNSEQLQRSELNKELLQQDFQKQISKFALFTTKLEIEESPYFYNFKVQAQLPHFQDSIERTFLRSSAELPLQSKLDNNQEVNASCNNCKEIGTDSLTSFYDAIAKLFLSTSAELIPEVNNLLWLANSKEKFILLFNNYQDLERVTEFEIKLEYLDSSLPQDLNKDEEILREGACVAYNIRVKLAEQGQIKLRDTIFVTTLPGIVNLSSAFALKSSDLDSFIKLN